MEFKTIPEIEKFLELHIPKSNVVRFPGEEGILRTKELLRLLGSPQNSRPAIHIAGTSGKGSTSFMISAFLNSQGFKTGLHLSPHLTDIRERVEISNTLLPENRYVAYFNEFYPYVQKMKNSAYGLLTYFELLVAFSFYVFEREKVDYMIMEVGMGGLYDGTNVIDRQDKLAVITKIGFDHMHLLGNTLSEIAYQKAMICPEKGTMISIFQSATAAATIETVASKKKTRLVWVEKKQLRNISAAKTGTEFTLTGGRAGYHDFRIGLLGAHQAQNASLALTALSYLSERDAFEINGEALRGVARQLRFKGRMDIVRFGTTVCILDGAHNTQKMKAFITSVREQFPGERFNIVIAFKKGKEYRKMLKMIIPLAKRIYITRIFQDHQDLAHFSTDPGLIRDGLFRLGFKNVRILSSMKEVGDVIRKGKTNTIVTGSLYLLGDVYTLLKC